MSLLKSCLKCQGTLKVEEDMYGRYLECIQCGFHQDLDAQGAIEEALARAGYTLRRQSPAA